MNDTPTQPQQQPQPHVRRLPAHLTVTATLAQLLQRLDTSTTPVDAEQYRIVAKRLSEALADVQPDAALQALLNAFPVAAELYENLNYRHAGLCRSPLEVSLAAELAARNAIALAGRIGDTKPQG